MTETSEYATGITTEIIGCFIDLLLLPFLWIAGNNEK